jgi:hypothetical protein
MEPTAHLNDHAEQLQSDAAGQEKASVRTPTTSDTCWLGYCLVWGGIAFNFRNKLLPYVALSTRNAETRALVYCVEGMMGVLVTLKELGFLPEGVTPLRLEVRSQAANNTLSTD